ncbi:unnamed protein product [Scytosiphon promiscuus]
MLPTAAESGTGGAAGKMRETGTGTSSVPRPLAPPEVGSFLSDEEEVEESDIEEDGREEEDQEGLAAAVEDLLAEVEVLRKADSFPDLEALSSIEKAGKYLGPTMESNWVLPGSLLVGAYPASMNDSHHAHLLCTILLQGVSTFVCLQQEYRAEGVTEEMWRSGDALRPYFQDVVQLLGKLRELRRAGGADGGGSGARSVPAIPANICAPEDTDFVHFPIVDCNVADDTKVLQLAGKLATRLARGEVMYLHCWGGHGRTGTVVCIMLHLMYGCSADEAMERCQHVHDVRRIPISVGSPQTEAQRQQVRRVIARVISHRSALASSTGRSSSSSSNSRGGSVVGGGVIADAAAAAAAAAAALSPESGKKRGGGSGGRDAGGRRAWVRGRRQAFAQAPNGVGEDVSGWLPDEDDDNDVNAEQREDAGTGAGKGKKAKARSGGRGGGGRMTSRVSTGALSSDGGGGALSPPPMPRRKSFTEPYSDDDPSRGTRMSGLRRKSAPGKPPADVLAARAGGSAVAGSGKEDYDAGVLSGTATKSTTPTKLGGSGVPLPLSPANRRSSGAGGPPRHSKGCCSVADTSPGSCTGVERCAARSSGGGEGGGAAGKHAPASCGGGGGSCRAR